MRERAAIVRGRLEVRSALGVRNRDRAADSGRDRVSRVPAALVVAVTPQSLATGFTLAHRVDSRSEADLAAPTTDIRVVRVPIVTGPPLQFVRLPWKSARFEVRRITQDNKGFLWFGASDGLRRYDGVRFIRVPGESPSQRSSGFILSESMMKDRAGMIWFGVDDFVNRYDPETGNTTQFRTSEGHACGSLGHAMHITQDHEGRMWIATDKGLRRLDPATSQVTCYRVSADDGSPNARDQAHLHPRVAQRWTLGRQRRRARSSRSAQRPGHTAFRARNSVRRAPSPQPISGDALRGSIRHRVGRVVVRRRSGVGRPGNRHCNRVRVRPARAAERIIRRAVDPRG